MKSKTFSIKLSLNKKTIANLKNKEMKNVIGGYPGTYGPYSCPNTICYTIYYPHCYTNFVGPCDPIT